MLVVIGIDIGGTKIRIGGSNKGINLGRSVYVRTPEHYAEALHLIAQSVATLTGRHQIEAIGIASPGPIDLRNGRILTPSHLPWHNVAICHDLKQVFACPVSLGHDTTLGGVAEANFGAGRDVSNLLYVSISTGIGSSQIINGQPLPGDYNSEGGRQLIQQEVHDRFVSFEDLASGAAIQRDFGKIAADIHKARDWDEIAHRLSLGLYNLIVITNPELVILGGGVAVHYHRFIRPLRRHLTDLQKFYSLPKITQARFVETAPLIGAVMLARSTTD